MPRLMNFNCLGMVAVAFAAAGCIGPSETSSMPKPGSGLVEYRKITRDAHRAVAAVVDALPAAADPDGHSALANFDRKVNELELTSLRVRARAEAIIARGQAYFDEWSQNLAGITNRTAARLDRERYDRLLEHYHRVRQRSGEVREQFRPFMAMLREFRARLDHPPNQLQAQPSTGRAIPAAQPSNGPEALKASAGRVLRALESVATGLDDAEVELHATLASKSKGGTP